MIGMATKAGKTLSGEFSTEKAIKSGIARLVIVAEDASDNTKKKFRNMCEYRNIPMYIYGDKESLGLSSGNDMRASLAVVDDGLAGSIVAHLTNTTK